MSPKQDVETLMKQLMPIATKQIETSGTFEPYGGVLYPSGKSKTLMSDGKSKDRNKTIQQMLTHFKMGADSREYTATCLFMDVSVTPPTRNEKIPAMMVKLDHIDNYSVEVFFPYRKAAEDGWLIDAPFAQEGVNDIFGSGN